MAEKRTRTTPGVGESGGVSRLDSTAMERVRVREKITVKEGDTPSPDGASKVRGTASWDSEPPKKLPSWKPEEPTGTRKRTSRPSPVTVDEVGPTAVRLARASRRTSAPKLLASRATISKAPIDHRAAFLLSMIDGKNGVDALIDMSGMDPVEVREMLERLARLGLIELP